MVKRNDLRFNFYNTQKLIFKAILITSLLQFGCNVDDSILLDMVDKHAVPEIGWLTFEPRIDPPSSLDSPPESGWPEPGQKIHWRAHVFNRSNYGMINARYIWKINQSVADIGKVKIPRGKTVIEFDHVWNATPEEISFIMEVDTSENQTVSDEITVKSNALSIGLWIEDALYQWMNHEPDIPPFELWACEQVKRWNYIIHRDVFGDEKLFEGATDQLRLDRIVVLPDNSPYPENLDTDFVWYFRKDKRDLRFLHVGAPLSVIEDQTIVLHELLHQRGLIDLYAYEVLDGIAGGNNVQILDPDGKRAAGTERLPFLSYKPNYSVLYTPNFSNALMGGNYRYPSVLTAHSVYGLNLFAGHRTPRWINDNGNYKSLSFNNPYITHVPECMELEFSSPSGGKLKNILIDVFLDQGRYSYDDIYSEEPQLTLKTDSTGIAILPSGLWNDITWRKRMHATVLILRARKPDNSEWGYTFLPVFNLNMAYIKGFRAKAQIPVHVQLR